MLLRQGIAILTALSLGRVNAFNAGHIPDDSWLAGHGFRHGDLEDHLHTWITTRTTPKGGWNFTQEDVDRIYFGNWLRDYSQIVDTGGLSILPEKILVTIVKVMGYINFDYGTDGYEITSDNLGVYLPVEHIDNPQGYADGKDARKYDFRLRPPVNANELLVDPTNGMKNYIASNGHGWDTSKAYIQRSIKACVAKGRAAHITGDKKSRLEAYRLLGGALHTLEDFLAHSNFIELTLIQMGYDNVFPFAGADTQIQAPSGKMVYPLVTGTFQRADMIHSFLGEAADFLAQASLTALKEKVDKATLHHQLAVEYNGLNVGKLDTIQAILANITMEAKLRAVTSAAKSKALGPKTHRKRKLHQAIYRIDQMHESVERDLGSVFGTISDLLDEAKDGVKDGLHDAISDLIALKDKVEVKVLDGVTGAVDDLAVIKDGFDALKDNLEVFVLNNLEPLLTPLISLATKEIYALMNKVLVSSTAQWEVFNNTRSTAPTHSLLSKDHFRLILNEPAGQIAQMVTTNTVSQVTLLWENVSFDVDAAVNTITESLFHPDFPKTCSSIQRQMTTFVQEWFNSLSPAMQRETIRRLTKDAVSNGDNVRFEIEKDEAKEAVKNVVAQMKTTLIYGPSPEDAGDSHLGLDSHVWTRKSD